MAIPKAVGQSFDQALKVLRDPLTKIALIEVEEEGTDRTMYVISMIQEQGADVLTLPLALMPFYGDDTLGPDDADYIAGFKLIPPEGADTVELGESSAVKLPDDLVDRFEAPEEIACSDDDWDEED
jgi:hypothetical protein